MFAVEEVDVSGAPVSGVILRLQRATKITGRVRFDAASLAPPADLSSVQVNLQVPAAVGYQPAGIATSQTVPLRADGTFAFVGIAPGPSLLSVTMPAAGTGWWLRSAILNGRDVLDSTLDIVSGTDIDNASLTLTISVRSCPACCSRPLGCRRLVLRHRNAGGFEVLDEELPSREVGASGIRRALRHSRSAAWSYLLVALTDVEPNEWQQPDFLASIAGAGVPVSIGEGQKKTQDLQIRR